MRISPDARTLIREAAAAQQQDVTSFVLGAALERARDVLMTDRVMRLSPAGMDQIEAALAEEPRVIPELAAAIRAVRAGWTATPEPGDDEAVRYTPRT